MRRIMITAFGSGSGKTVLTGALLCAFMRKGLFPEGYKCGPDYIDPSFHRQVLGVPSHNLDLVLQGEKALHETLAAGTGQIGVIEGAMGWFDGLGGTAQGSAWDIAARENIPALLCIRPGGAALTMAAMVNGLKTFRAPDMIRGIFLTDCKKTLFDYLKPILERECGLPVTGFLPPMPEMKFESRHLGLVTAEEVTNLKERFAAAADVLEQSGATEKIFALAEEAQDAERSGSAAARQSGSGTASSRCRIAVARDEAFCFYYQESLEALEKCGADLVFFSPLRDEHLPDAQGLYLGGGYPELYAEALSKNTAMKEEIARAVRDGMPTIAECGGFLYLQRQLEDPDGKTYPMAGVLPGDGFRAGRLVRFGYCFLEAKEDGLLFRKGEHIPAHEFHHWDSTDCGSSLAASGSRGGHRRCAFTSPTLYAGFPHLHLGGEKALAERFAQAAYVYGEKGGLHEQDA